MIAAVLIPFAVAMLGAMVLLWPQGGSGKSEHHTGLGFDREMRDARVISVREVDCASVGVRTPQGSDEPETNGPAAGGPGPGGSGAEGSGAGGSGAGDIRGSGERDCQQATVEVRSGPDRGQRFEQLVTPDELRRLSAGQDVVVAHSPQAPPELRYSVTDVQRTVPLAVLAGVFALVVVLVGRLRGLLALVGLAVSFAVLTLFILPAVLEGSDPLVVAVVGGSVIMLVTLYLCHGWTARTSVAALGTLVSLLLIGVLGSVFIGWSALTGNTSDQTGLIHGLYPQLEIRGLLLAGVLIGSLGVLDDVTVTQTSAVWELRHADPAASWRRLYGAAMRIGRDHIASVVNTLVMAYAGAALPLLLLFSIAHSGVETVATSELVAEEIVRTLVGSIGLVAAVPVTTLLAALIVSADRQPRPDGFGGRPSVTSGRRRRKR